MCCEFTWQVPSSHLSELSVWGETEEEPVDVRYPQGEGVRDTDFLLYVRAVSSFACTQVSILLHFSPLKLFSKWKNHTQCKKQNNIYHSMNSHMIYIVNFENICYFLGTEILFVMNLRKSFQQFKLLSFSK